MATIGINALYLIPNKVGGTEYYLRSFIKYLQIVDRVNTYVLFCSKEAAPTFKKLNTNWKVVACDVQAEQRIVRLLFEQLVLPSLVKKEHCDLLHSFGYFGPLGGSFLKIVTVHDTNWLDHPEDTSQLTNFILNLLIKGSVSASEKILVDSDYGYSRLVHHIPSAQQKVVVLYPGIDDDFKKLLRSQNKKFYNGKYILCVSALYPHKKVIYLLKLWKLLSKVLTDYSLILVGQNGKDMPVVAELTHSIKRVRWIKKASYADLISLYKYADLCILPSVYEGFGYPTYEALTALKKTIVGKIGLYHPATRKYLRELSFKYVSDLILVTKTLKEKSTPVPATQLSYEIAAKKLITLYTSVLGE